MLLPPSPPLSSLGRAALAASSALLALRHPARADLVALVSDATAGPPLTLLTRRLSRSAPDMLHARSPPRFPSPGLFSAMHGMPDGSLGRAYARFMDDRAFDPSDRPAVNARLVPAPDEAWALQRYRDVHDLWHVLCDVPTTLFGEVCLKWFEAVHTGLPGPALSAVGGPVRLTPRQRFVLVKEIAPWAVEVGRGCDDLLAIRYEDVLERQVLELREEWGLRTPRDWLTDPEVLYRKRRTAPSPAAGKG